MSVNYTQIAKIIPEAVSQLPAYRKTVSSSLEQARCAFTDAQDHQEELIHRIKHYTQNVDRMARCACPTEEPIGDQYPPQEIDQSLTMVAADASQLLPDDYNGDDWGAVNTALLIQRMHPDKCDMPIVHKETEMFLENHRFTPGGIIESDESVDLYRDLRERELLAEGSVSIKSGLVLSLMDGQTELYGSRDPLLAGSFKASLEKTKSAYEKMKNQSCYYAGYVNGRRSNLITRMIEIAMTPDESLMNLRRSRPLSGIVDPWIFQGMSGSIPPLKPGYRSAIFELCTARSQGVLNGELAVHFFYMNVGGDIISRVEIPAFYRQNVQIIALLQGAICRQCSLIKDHHYPYLLARCHEECMIDQQTKEQIRAMLRSEFIRQGIPFSRITAKTMMKRLTR